MFSDVAGARVLIVDRHPLVADTLAARLNAEADLSVVATTTAPQQAVTATQMLRPDVVVIDVASEDDPAAELTRMLREKQPDVRVVVIGDDTDTATIGDCLCAGAHAWVLRETAATTLVAAIHGAMLDETYIAPKLLTLVIRQLRDARSSRAENGARVARLTERERSVLECMIEGLDREEIARRLGVSLNTVRTHAQNCYAKLGVHSSLEAVRVAFRAGIRPRVISADTRRGVRRRQPYSIFDRALAAASAGPAPSDGSAARERPPGGRTGLGWT
jgi:two-component system NarL family response regulator